MANGIKMRKGNGNITTFLLFLKGLEILHKERRRQVDAIHEREDITMIRCSILMNNNNLQDLNLLHNFELFNTNRNTCTVKYFLEAIV